MKKLCLSVCLLLAALLSARAQELALVNADDSVRTVAQRLFPQTNPNLSAHMNLLFATSGVVNLTEGKLDDAYFRMNSVRWEVLGSFSKQFSYHLRQSYNKSTSPRPMDKVAASVDYALVHWKPSDRFTLTAGKQMIGLGGYEYYVSSIKVREYSDFNNHITCYQAGLAGAVRMSPTQELVMQVVNFRGGDDADVYAYGLPEGVRKSRVPLFATLNWNSFYAPDRAYQLRYAASWGQLAENKNIYMLTTGHVYKRGPVLAYADVLYSREELDSKGLISDLQGPAVETPCTARHAEYFSVVGDFDYRFHPHWNFYLKGTYERSGVYRSNGPFAKGLYRTSWNAQACVEYFPMSDSELYVFAHLLYKGNHLTRRAQALGATSTDTQRISVGLVYCIPVF